MRIMSFNTQHCHDYKRGFIRFETMADAINAVGADIVGLNEIRGKGILPGFTDQAERLSELTGLSHSYFAKAIDIGIGKNPYGNALISRIPIVRAETVPVPDPPKAGRVGRYHYETRCLLKAELEGGITVLVIHFGLNPEEAANAVATVVPHIASERCILMGDFNVTPEDPVLMPIRERMRDTAELFRGPLLSFPSDKPERKIDYIFVSPDVEVMSADIPDIVASDHRPHVADTRLG